MKRAMILAIGAVAVARMTTPAESADLPAVAPPPPFSWTGCYLGGNIGAKWGSSDGDATIAVPPSPFFIAPPPPTTTVAFTSARDSDFAAVGGGQVGCQWQTGGLVLGGRWRQSRPRQHRCCRQGSSRSS
jgi:outer membrane immunogenic protein